MPQPGAQGGLAGRRPRSPPRSAAAAGGRRRSAPPAPSPSWARRRTWSSSRCPAAPRSRRWRTACSPRRGPGQIVADCSTAPMTLARRLAERFAAAGAAFVDSPVARTRAAARAGTLCAMVGGDAAAFARVRPFLACFATDILHCGAAGAGQLAKAMNNMVLMQTVNALAEALTAARRLGGRRRDAVRRPGRRLGGQFRAPQPRDEGAAARRLPGARPFLPAGAQGPRLRVRRGRGGGGRPCAARRSSATACARAVDMGLGDAYYPALIAAIDRRDPDRAN